MLSNNRRATPRHFGSGCVADQQLGQIEMPVGNDVRQVVSVSVQRALGLLASDQVGPRAEQSREPRD